MIYFQVPSMEDYFEKYVFQSEYILKFDFFLNILQKLLKI